MLRHLNFIVWFKYFGFYLSLNWNLKVPGSHGATDHLSTVVTETMDINDPSSARTVRSSTLNRDQLNKSKSPGRINLKSFVTETINLWTCIDRKFI